MTDIQTVPATLETIDAEIKVLRDELLTVGSKLATKREQRNKMLLDAAAQAPDAWVLIQFESGDEPQLYPVQLEVLVQLDEHGHEARATSGDGMIWLQIRRFVFGDEEWMTVGLGKIVSRNQGREYYGFFKTKADALEGYRLEREVREAEEGDDEAPPFRNGNR